MRGAVEFGTAHRARDDGAIAGKTGTCTNDHTHLGWFGSFNEVGNRKLVVVVLLTGGRSGDRTDGGGYCGRCLSPVGRKELLRVRDAGNAGFADCKPDLLLEVAFSGV